MLSLSDNIQADIVKAFNTTSRYLDDLLIIDNPYFAQMVKVSKCAKIRNRYNQVPHMTQDTNWESDKLRYIPLDIDLSITNGIDSNKIYDKWDDINFEIVNFPFHDGNGIAPVYISQLIRFARVCSHVDDFNNRNKVFDF